MGTETIEFDIDKNEMIRQIIFNQAGTVEKALLEAMANSVDAGATRCDITLTRDDCDVVDDGRGFKSLHEIREWFGTFAKTQDAASKKTYGRFRIGRGQIFAKGKNVWISNEFRLTVDAKSDASCFTCHQDISPPVPGCSIHVDFYDKLSQVDLLQVCRAIEKLAGYMPSFGIVLTLNGKAIGKDARREKWDHETDDAWIKFSESSTLDVYNLGSHVRGMYVKDEGRGGVVVTKVRVDVNQARNDINSSCPVWRRIRKFVSDHSGERRRNLTDAEREYLAEQMLVGTLDRKTAMDAEVFTDVRSRHWSVAKLRGTRYRFNYRMTSAKRGSRLGDKVHGQRLAFVMADETLARFSTDSLAKVVGIISRLAGGDPWKAVPFSKVTSGLSSKHDIVAKLDEKPSEKVWLSLLRHGERFIRRAVSGLEADGWDGKPVAERSICIGESDSFDGWTDGSSYIAIGREFLAGLSFDARGVFDAYDLLRHEYCHDGPDGDSHDHNVEFYQKYHDAARGAAKGAGLAWNNLPMLVEQAGKALGKREAHLNDRLERIGKAVKELDALAASVTVKEQAVKGRKPKAVPQAPEPAVPVPVSGNPYKPGSDYAVLFAAASSGFAELSVVLEAVSSQVSKAVEKVRNDWYVLANPNHKSNRGSRKEVDARGKVRLVRTD